MSEAMSEAITNNIIVLRLIMHTSLLWSEIICKDENKKTFDVKGRDILKIWK